MTTPTIGEIFGMRAPTVSMMRSIKPVETSNPDLVMGMELEVENCEHSDDWYIDRVNKLGWNVTVDHSLRGTNVSNGGNAEIENPAFEFISKPMQSGTLLGALQAFFDVTKFSEENYSDRCSVHIHVNCTNLVPETVSAVSLLYSVMEEVLFRFVGNHRDSNIYCMPWSQCRMNYDIVQRMCTDAQGSVRRWQKYTALNLLPLREHGTVEFRHMHGTADMKKLTTWVNIIGSLFRYATATELTELIKEIKTLNSNSEYESFFNKVLGNALPYDETYRPAMEAGVICAKFGLLNWKKAKPVATYLDDYLDANSIATETVRQRVVRNVQMEFRSTPSEWATTPQAPVGWPEQVAIAAGGGGGGIPAPTRTTPNRIPTRAAGTPRTYTEENNRFLPWPLNGTTVSYSIAQGQLPLNDDERALLRDSVIATLYTANPRAPSVTITGQPGFSTRQRLGIRTQAAVDRLAARIAAGNGERVMTDAEENEEF